MHKNTNFDVPNGPTFDLADDVNFDQLLYDVAAGEFSACVARPDMSSFSHHHAKHDTAPRRKVEGPDRYGCKKLSPAISEVVRLHTLVAFRIAQLLGLLMVRTIPFVFDIAGVRGDLLSVAYLDEHRTLLAHPDVQHTRSVL